MHNEYQNYLKGKIEKEETNSIDAGKLSKALFPFQRDVVEMLLNVGRGAAFLDTGLGKTIVQCEWARHIPGKVLFVAPLAVAHQTCREAKKLLGMDIIYSKTGEAESRFTITNYERVHLFDTDMFEGVVLDESSILKGFMSKTKLYLCNEFKDTPYKLACTATPAPNDYMELGNHAEFLGIMKSNEMLSRWFINDPSSVGKYVLKGHAVKPFWEWVSSWAACVTKPSDIGYKNDGYDLPPLNIKTHTITDSYDTAFDKGMLFDVPESLNATSLHKEKKKTIADRVQMVADMVNDSDKPWLVWCESNQESQMLAKSIPDAVEVKGSDKPDVKESRLIDFTDGNVRVLVSKSSICGFGMNWQHCRDIAFASVSYSYERFYQAVRRSWRFGQTDQVNVHVVIAEAEIPVWRAVESKATDHEAMKDHMKYATFNKGCRQVQIDYHPTCQAVLPNWLMEGE